MKILFILFLSILFLYGCSTPKGNLVCNNACVEKGFTEGKCETLGVVPTPCETKFNKTTIYSEEGYCDEYGKDTSSFWEWNVNRKRIVGVGNMCCCN